MKYFVFIVGAFVAICAFASENAESKGIADSDISLDSAFVDSQSSKPHQEKDNNRFDDNTESTLDYAQKAILLESAKINAQPYIQKALDLKLYENKEWLTLLHSNGKKSEIKQQSFFYAKNGRKSAKDEMIATILEIYTSPQILEIPPEYQKLIQAAQLAQTDSNIPKRSSLAEDYHAMCRFPARFAFLYAHLRFKNLPNIACDEYHTMLTYVNPKSVSIVFPSAYINSPASMFGHTFLLLESDYKSKLLSYALNYAANADSKQENMFGFAIKGLFGGYNGVYSMLPYYDKLKEYRDTESRDIWEIELNLNPKEVERLFAHLWELRDLQSPYLFFTKNCSYNILWLLEAARPGVNLRKYFVYQVNPPETIFAMQRENLILRQTYRPSKRTIINAYRESLSVRAVSKVKKLALGKISPQSILDSRFSLQEKQFILEASNELSEYNYIHQKLNLQEYTSIAHDIATQRATLGKSPELKIKTPKSVLDGNQGGRISAFSVFKDSQSYAGFEFRLTYHDTTDSDAGYLKGSQIEFLKGSIYLDFSKDSYKKLQIQEAKILSIESYGAFNQIFHPISFRINTGFDRRFLEDKLAYYISLGGGLSFNMGHYAFVYYFLEPLFFVQRQANVALANVAGINLSDNNRLKLVLEYQNRIYGKVNANQIYATLSINLVRNLALFGRYEHYFYNESYIDRGVGIFGIRAYF